MTILKTCGSCAHRKTIWPPCGRSGMRQECGKHRGWDPAHEFKVWQRGFCDDWEAAPPVVRDVELNPCPICGGEVRVASVMGKVYGVCATCGCQSGLCNDEEELAGVWNNRVPNTAACRPAGS